MVESSPVESSATTSNIDIAIAITSPLSKPSQAVFIEPSQISTEAFIKHISETLTMLQRLRLYEKQQNNDDSTMITRLNRYESIVRARFIVNHNKQVDITSFFTRKDN